MKQLLLKCAVAGLTLTCLAAAAQTANSYPNRPVRLMVPASAGGGGDAFARLLAEHLGKRLGQPFVVENNAGAGGTIAIAQLAHAKPDGYTVGLGTMTTTTLMPAVYKSKPYDPVKDLTTVARIGTAPVVMVATQDFPASDLKSFIARAKGSPQAIQFGSWGPGSTGQFCAEVLAQKTGIKLEHIPFKGAAPAVTALMGGVIKVAWLDTGSAIASVRAGKFKPIAMCTRRSANFPNVATYKEQGVDFDQWTGWSMFGPANLPPAIAERLASALQETLKDPAVTSKMLDWGITADYLSGQQQAAINSRDIEVWKKIAQEANISLD